MKTCFAVAEGMGLTRITSPLSLSMNVLLSHQDLLKDFYLNSTHSVPSDLSFFFFFVLNCQLAHNAGRGWVLRHPGHFFLNINCLMWRKGHSSVPVSSPPCKLAVINVQGRKCLFVLYCSFTGSIPLCFPLLFSINLM